MAPHERKAFGGQFDSVVMLTWSDWKTEPRSNRYHYATRFARDFPVVFVQPDLEEAAYTFEETGVQNLCVLHVYQKYGDRQRRLLARALKDRAVLRPLLWAYNAHFAEFFAECFSPLKIYHATEDYFVPGGTGNEEIAIRLRELLVSADLLIAVSAGVRDSYVRSGRYKGECLILENGCDFEFWLGGKNASPDPARKIALYQGGINRRLDWQLIGHLVEMLPTWEFWFCGQAHGSTSELETLRRQQNFKYLGPRTPEQLREVARQCTVGLIPFVQERYIEVSLPLKAFEYVACDLPVVTVPIEALRRYPDIFSVATDAEGFAQRMESAVRLRDDPNVARQRAEFGARNSYESRFRELQSWIDQYLYKEEEQLFRASVLVLYDINSTHVSTLYEHLSSFALFSNHDVFYANCTGTARPKVPLASFNAVVVHYSVRVNLDNHLSPWFASALREYAGLKVLFIQDEYDTTEVARTSMQTLGIHVVYTCVPEASIPRVYDPKRFASVRFITTLTGYVPLSHHASGKPNSQRHILIGYRGRALPYWYGDLGQEKKQIGQRMREECERRNLPVDIEWEDRHRIYGEAWYEFLANVRVTLGTESGSNIFDDTGSIKAQIENALAHDPGSTYESVRERFLAGKEGPVRMNQISPKVFEAITLRTALVLYEGTYSGVVEPGRHYISLKKDFSNIDEVLSKIQDEALLTDLTERAYQEIVASGKYSYETFVRGFDQVISSCARNRVGAGVLAIACGRKTAATAEWRPISGGYRIFEAPTTAPLNRSNPRSNRWLVSTGKAVLEVLQPIWHKVPRPFRRVVWRVIHVLATFRRFATSKLVGAR